MDLFLKRHGNLILLFLVGVFSLNQFLTLRSQGIRHGSDTGRYTSGAKQIREGSPLVEKQGSYLGYIVFLALNQRFLSGERSAVVLQILVSFLAMLCLYQLAKSNGGAPAGLAAAFFYAAFPDFAMWNVFILTDSLYSSFVVFTLYAYHRARQSPQTWALPTLLCTLITISLRPTGWLFVILLPTFIIFGSRALRPARWAILIGGACLFLAACIFVPKVRQGIEKERPAHKIQKGEVICEYADWIVAMPKESALEEGGVTSMLMYIAQHPVSVMKLGATRMMAALMQVRPYYSPAHNLVLALFLIPTYLLALIGLLRASGSPMFHVLELTIAAHLGLIAISFADWDGRYLVHFLPCILVMTGVGTGAALSKLVARRSRMGSNAELLG